MLTKYIETNQLQKNATCCFKKMLEATPNKIAAVQPFTTISQNIQEGRTRHGGHCRRSKGEVIIFYGLLHTDSPVLADQQKYQLWANTGYCLEDLPGALDGKDGWRERERERERERDTHTHTHTQCGPYFQRDVMMMMIYFIYIYIVVVPMGEK